MKKLLHSELSIFTFTMFCKSYKLMASSCLACLIKYEPVAYYFRIATPSTLTESTIVLEETAASNFLLVQKRQKVKFSLEQATKAQRGCRGIALLFL
jgi:hypothetical protein